MFNRTPSEWMFDQTFDSYSVAYAKDSSGAKTETFTLENDDVKCFCQTPTDNVIALYSQRNEIVDLSLWFMSSTVYDSLAIEDRITYDSVNYKIVGKVDVRVARKLYRLDLASEVS